MQNHQMALWCDDWVKKNYGVDPLHRDHSINCTPVAMLHFPALPPFPGHVSLLDAGQTIGSRVDALQVCHADLFRRVYALHDMIPRTFVRVPLDIVRQNVLSLRWQPMMLSQLRCGTKLDHLKLLNTIRHVQQATRHDLPLYVDMKIHYELLKYRYGQSCTSWNVQLHWSSLPLIYGVWHPYKHTITMLYRNFMPIICLIQRVHTDFKEGDVVPTKVKLQDCNWAGRDPGSGKNALAVVESCYAFFGGGSMGECGVHQDIGGCFGHMAAWALSNAWLYSQ